VFLGLVAVAVGVSVFLERVGGIDQVLPALRKWWPLAVIAFGLANLIRFAPRPWGVLGPLLLVAVGAVLLLVTFGFLQWDDYPLLWPAALVVAGFAVALAGADWPDQRLPYQNEVRQFVLLRGKRLACQAPAFWRADLTVLLGSFELDLREAELARRAVVNVNAVFGTVDIIAREGVPVHERRPFLLDRFGLHAEVPPEFEDGLTVSVLAFFGRTTIMQATRRRSNDTRSASS
jgi:hypothetical protein